MDLGRDPPGDPWSVYFQNSLWKKSSTFASSPLPTTNTLLQVSYAIFFQNTHIWVIWHIYLPATIYKYITKWIFSCILYSQLFYKILKLEVLHTLLLLVLFVLVRNKTCMGNSQNMSELHIYSMALYSYADVVTKQTHKNLGPDIKSWNLWKVRY